MLAMGKRLGSHDVKMNLVAANSLTTSTDSRRRAVSTRNEEEVRKFSNVDWNTDRAEQTGVMGMAGRFKQRLGSQAGASSAAVGLAEMHPCRMEIIRDYLSQKLQKQLREEEDPQHGTELEGFRVLDVGSGGGLITNSFLRLGAEVTAIDPSQSNIDYLAEMHARGNGTLKTFCGTIEDYIESLGAAKESDKFDLVCCLEVIEHVENYQFFLDSLCSVVKATSEHANQPKKQTENPSASTKLGMLVLSTLNRSLQSYLLGIVAAEYVLEKVPVGTHEWYKFIKPVEVEASITARGLHVDQVVGMKYNPLTGKWSKGRDTSVNYLLFAST